MDLQKYFASLSSELVAGGMSEAQSAAYCKRLITSLESLDEDARKEKLASYGTPSQLAQRVLAIAGKAKAEPEQKPQNTALEHTVNVENSSRFATKRVSVAPPAAEIHSGSSEESAPKSTPVASDKTQVNKKTAEPITEAAQPEEIDKKPISKRGMNIFWWTAILTSPISLFLLCVLAALFLIVYAALIVSAIVMIIAVTVTVIGGILLSLVGMGYGIVNMLPGTDAFFVGLYEFGLGLIIVGATIVFPILEYNFATVLVPYTIKKLTVFLRFTMKQIKRLVVYLYDRCREL